MKYSYSDIRTGLKNARKSFWHFVIAAVMFAHVVVVVAVFGTALGVLAVLHPWLGAGFFLATAVIAFILYEIDAAFERRVFSEKFHEELSK